MSPEPIAVGAEAYACLGVNVHLHLVDRLELATGADQNNSRPIRSAAPFICRRLSPSLLGARLADGPILSATSRGLGSITTGDACAAHRGGLFFPISHECV